MLLSDVDISWKFRQVQVTREGPYKTVFVCPSRSEVFLFITLRLMPAWCPLDVWPSNKAITSDK